MAIHPKARGEKFLTPEQLKAKSKKWGHKANTREKDDYDDGMLYGSDPSEGSLIRYSKHVNRTESNGEIQKVHSMSFIDRIEELLTQGKDHVKVMDLGGGSCLYARQIRERFGEKVKVYTTGLRNKSAQYELCQALNDDNAKLHPNDLKWRSIQELTDFPEFDIIIDTIGELEYMDKTKQEGKKTSIDKEKIREYLQAVIKKLNPGGVASISATCVHEFYDGAIIHQILHELQQREQLEFEYDLKNDVIKIFK